MTETRNTDTAKGKVGVFRLTRLDRWRGLIYFLGWIYLSLIVLRLSMEISHSNNTPVGEALACLLMVLIGRRTIDAGYGGFFCVLMWVPGINVIYLFYLAGAPSDEANRYGPPAPELTAGEAMVLCLFAAAAPIILIVGWVQGYG